MDSRAPEMHNRDVRENSVPLEEVLEGPVHERLNRYFDTSVFSQPAPFTLGNVSAYVAGLRNDMVRNFDLSLFKDFTPVEWMRIQIRGEFLNAFNTPRFGSPNTSVTSSAFGTIAT